MALPANNTPWPPKPFAEMYSRDIAEWAKWWAGTASSLSSYRSTAGAPIPAKLSERIPFAYDVLTGKDRKAAGTGDAGSYVHIPVAGSIHRMIAALIAATPPRFVIPTDDEEDIPIEEAEPKPEPEIDPLTGIPIEPPEPTAEEILAQRPPPNPLQERLDFLVNTDLFHSQLYSAAESCPALGGVYMRVVWDEEVYDDRPFIDIVDADHAVPEWRWHKLVAVTFWNDIKGDKDTLYRHLQRYEKGRIVHALYEGNEQEIGRMVPLTDLENEDVPQTIKDQLADIALLIDAEGAIATGDPDNLSAVYIPFRRNNPAWRHDSQLKWLGQSAVSKDVIPLLEGINEVASSLMRDVRQGKSRIVISENLLTLAGAGRGSTFDYDKELFTPIAETVDVDGKPVMDQVQFEVRGEQLFSVIDGITKHALRRIGISPLTYGLVEAVATTATEIKAWTRDTSQTQEAMQRLWGPELTSIISSLLRVDAYYFGGGDAEDDGVAGEVTTELEEDVEIEWPPMVEESDEEAARIIGLWKTAEAASKFTIIQRLHPDWDKLEVEAEIARIKDDTPAEPVMPFEANPPVDDDEADEEPTPPFGG